jgi:hypothetical protein
MMSEVKKKYHVPLYGGWLVVVFTDQRKLGKVANRHFQTKYDDGDKWKALVVDRKGALPRLYPVVLPDKATHGDIAHEAVHLTNHIFRDTRVDTGYDQDEHYAYMMTWIVEKIHKVRKKFDKLRK